MLNEREILAHVKLQFQAKISDTDDCWQEGYEAAQTALDETDNPYQPDSKAYQFWLDGWWAGLYEESSDFETVPDYQHKNVIIKSDKTVIQQTLANKVPTVKRYIMTFLTVFFVGMCFYELTDMAA